MTDSSTPVPQSPQPTAPHFEIPTAAEGESPRAWEQIEAGRFMPRRTRGSLRGRALG